MVGQAPSPCLRLQPFFFLQWSVLRQPRMGRLGSAGLGVASAMPPRSARVGRWPPRQPLVFSVGVWQLPRARCLRAVPSPVRSPGSSERSERGCGVCSKEDRLTRDGVHADNLL